MTYSTLLQQLLIFIREQQQLLSTSSSLHERLLITYNQQTMKKINTLVQIHHKPSKLALALKDYLAENWTLVKGTYLSPTAIPNSTVVQLLCTIAQFSSNNIKPHHGTFTPLQLLMPTVQYESFRDGYLDLNEMPLQTVIATHILGRDSEFLLPIRLLTEINLDNPDTWTQLRNPYYNGEDASKYHTNPEELERLKNHNLLTKCLGERFEQFELLSKDKHTLLGQLRRLCQYLQLNSTEGIGTEGNAASGVYPPLIEFNKYYTQLDQAQKESIPPLVKKEIALLLELASNPAININATETMETCIATRRTRLIEAMSNQEATLAMITVTQTQQAHLVHDAKVYFIRAHQELKTALRNTQLIEGSDHLPLNLKLLQRLNVPLAIHSQEALTALKLLRLSEFKDILTNAKIRLDIIRTLHNLENFTFYLLLDIPSDKVGALVRHCAQEIMDYFIKTPRDLRNLLMLLPLEKFSLVCQGMQAFFPRIIRSVFDLTSLFHHLNVQQCALVCQTMNEKLSKVIQTTQHFKQLCQSSSKQQRSIIIQALTQATTTPQVKAFYQRLWDSPLVINLGETTNIKLLRAAQLLIDYTKNNSKEVRPAFFYLSRPHIKTVTLLINQIKHGEITNTTTLQNQLYAMLDQENIHPNSILLKRIGFILSHLQEAEPLEHDLAQPYHAQF